MMLPNSTIFHIHRELFGIEFFMSYYRKKITWNKAAVQDDVYCIDNTRRIFVYLGAVQIIK